MTKGEGTKVSSQSKLKTRNLSEQWSRKENGEQWARGEGEAKSRSDSRLSCLR